MHGEYDPTSSMRRVAIVQQIQNLLRCQCVEDLGSALEDWLSKKRQYEMFVRGQERTALPGIRRQPCGGHVPVEAKEPGRDRHVHQRGRGLPGVVSTKQSVKMSEIKRQNRRNDPMDVDALSKGEGMEKKGSSGSGKGSKGQDNMSNVVCWKCGKSGHYEKDCRQKWTQDRGWWRD